MPGVVVAVAAWSILLDADPWLLPGAAVGGVTSATVRLEDGTARIHGKVDRETVDRAATEAGCRVVPSTLDPRPPVPDP